MKFGNLFLCQHPSSLTDADHPDRLKLTNSGHDTVSELIDSQLLLVTPWEGGDIPFLE